MSLSPVLTHTGLLAFQAAKAGGAPVVLTTIALGSAPRLPIGTEEDLVTPIVSGAITSHTLNNDSGQLDVGVLIDGQAAGIEAAHVVHEAGVFDQDGRLIFYWASPDSFGSITPVTAYALNVAVVMAQADAAVVQIIDQGPPWDAIIDQKLAALALKSRDVAFRNLFLAQS